jgi:hypothetical protein
MSLFDGLRWVLREGGDRVLRALGTGPPSTTGSQEQAREEPDRRSKLGEFPQRQRLNLTRLRRRILTKLWRH